MTVEEQRYENPMGASGIHDFRDSGKVVSIPWYSILVADIFQYPPDFVKLNLR